MKTQWILPAGNQLGHGCMGVQYLKDPYMHRRQKVGGLQPQLNLSPPVPPKSVN